MSWLDDRCEPLLLGCREQVGFVLLRVALFLGEEEGFRLRVFDMEFWSSLTVIGTVQNDEGG